MPIVSTEIVEDRIQIDGRRFIAERHVDHLGVGHVIRYLAESAADPNAVASARIAVLEQQLAAWEMGKNFVAILDGRFDDVTAQHNTVDSVRTAIREFYQTATGEQVGRLAAFLLTLSDAQLRALFNITQAQVPTLRVRLQARVDALNAVLTAAGE